MRKVKTRQEIAIEYGINRKTLHRWLTRENIELPHRLLLPRDQDTIYNTFGLPPSEPYVGIASSVVKG